MQKKEQGKSFLDLTDEEVRQVVTDMFSPKKITCIKRHKKLDEITCNIYTEWVSTDDDGKEVTDVCRDELTLMNPFDYGGDAIHVQFQITSRDYDMLKSFCYNKAGRILSVFRYHLPPDRQKSHKTIRQSPDCEATEDHHNPYRTLSDRHETHTCQ